MAQNQSAILFFNCAYFTLYIVECQKIKVSFVLYPILLFLTTYFIKNHKFISNNFSITLIMILGINKNTINEKPKTSIMYK